MMGTSLGQQMPFTSSTVLAGRPAPPPPPPPPPLERFTDASSAAALSASASACGATRAASCCTIVVFCGTFTATSLTPSSAPSAPSMMGTSLGQQMPFTSSTVLVGAAPGGRLVEVGRVACAGERGGGKLFESACPWPWPCASSSRALALGVACSFPAPACPCPCPCPSSPWPWPWPWPWPRSIDRAGLVGV